MTIRHKIATAFAMIWVVVWMIAILCSRASAINVLDQLNLTYRIPRGLPPYLPDAGLTAAAEAGAQAQARFRSASHHGTMPSGTAAGAGHGQIGPPFKFRTCYNREAYRDKRGRLHPDWFSNHRYAGAAIVNGYAELSLDNNRNRGAIGSASRKIFRRRGLFRRRR